MNESCPTVKVQADNEQGFKIINESDFDEKVYIKFEEKTTPKSAKKDESEKK